MTNSKKHTSFTKGEGPFGEDDELRRVVSVRIHPHEGKGISAKDVLGQHIFDYFPIFVAALLFADFGVFGVKDLEEAFTAGVHIVLKQLHAVNAHDRFHGVQFIIVTASAPRTVNAPDHCQLPPQNFRQKVSVAAGWLQKAAFNALRLLLYKIEHGIDLTLSRHYFAVIRHALPGFDLLVCHARSPPFHTEMKT